ncbi:hypothetical protein Ferp_2516 [Ferroglobus placidus DSM 10642]|uniref:Uncharacterized protein n=1 Tax=Ferroglobus placidus (strain DSM 10642 / AEDII12DO) TaxID=589924 RepID=D3S2D2_FERPA|nr:hypothetical protein [Ferroglobus placidus]ADC66623.1 hypothetical protein Ferp_2516 [Ferroglobus placidus DSM 10642]
MGLHFNDDTVLGNLFASELSEVVEKGLSLQELVELGKLSRKPLKIERFGDKTLTKLVKIFEKLSSIEDTLKKIMAVRSAILVDSIIASSARYEELQKVRRLGNGLCVYLSRKLRNYFEVVEGDTVSVKVVDGKVILERI